MMKKFLLILSLLISLPVFAGEYEDALKEGGPAFLYLHTNYCKYCKQFNPIYEKLAQANKNSCRFISVDADTKYGQYLMYQLKGRYIPLVVMVDSRRQFMINIPPDCLLDYACVDKEVKEFIGK